MSERLFFALWPGDALRARLAQTMGLVSVPRSARAQRPDQWHVTLVFLGRVPVERLGDVLRSASAVRAAPVTVRFGSIEHWRRPQVLVATAAAIPAPLTFLVEQLRGALSSAGFPLEARDYRPHITLARKVLDWDAATRLAQPIHWSSRRFALVRSISASTGSRYEPTHWWNLSAEKS